MSDDISIYDGFTEYLISGKGGGNKRKVHAPGPDRHSTKPKPLCVHHGGQRVGGAWFAEYHLKDAAVIPNGHYPECKKCLEVLGGTNSDA